MFDKVGDGAAHPDDLKVFKFAKQLRYLCHDKTFCRSCEEGAFDWQSCFTACYDHKHKKLKTDSGECKSKFHRFDHSVWTDWGCETYGQFRKECGPNLDYFKLMGGQWAGVSGFRRFYIDVFKKIEQTVPSVKCNKIRTRNKL